MQTADSGLLQNFWRKADPALWTDAKKSAVEGYTPGTTAAWARSFVPIALAANARGCGLKDESKVYDPIKNPKGVRCTSQEMRVNIYGRDPKTGFARKGQDNIGVQYGLAALNSGAITVDDFLELNQKIGGNDIDGNSIPERVTGDRMAIRAAYQSGLLNSGGGGLATVPILHTRPYADQRGDIHDRERDFTIRARLENSTRAKPRSMIRARVPMARHSNGRSASHSPGARKAASWSSRLASSSQPRMFSGEAQASPADFSFAIPLNR